MSASFFCPSSPHWKFLCYFFSSTPPGWRLEAASGVFNSAPRILFLSSLWIRSMPVTCSQLSPAICSLPAHGALKENTLLVSAERCRVKQKIPSMTASPSWPTPWKWGQLVASILHLLHFIRGSVDLDTQFWKCSTKITSHQHWDLSYWSFTQASVSSPDTAFLFLKKKKHVQGSLLTEGSVIIYSQETFTKSCFLWICKLNLKMALIQDL